VLFILRSGALAFIPLYKGRGEQGWPRGKVERI
jgi:hypothetical protein